MDFVFANGSWEMTEIYESISSITLLGGVLDEVELTAAIIKGKIET